MSGGRFCSLAVLCSVLIYTLVSPSASASCCLKYSRKLPPCHRLTGYTIQAITSVCDLNAVIFHTRGGRFVCAQPSNKPTLNRIRCLSRRQEKAA